MDFTTLKVQSNALIITARKRSLRQGNVFTRVCYSVHGGGLTGQRPRTETPPDRDSPLCGKERVVRIILECILVNIDHIGKQLIE